ncbi:MAG: VCBS repeat-containing protein [Cyclobacteriaceae bacterium]
MRSIPLLIFLSCLHFLQGQPLPFSQPIEISNGSVRGISALDAADLNGDGLLDVAVFDGGAHAKGGAIAAWFEQRDDAWVRHEIGTAEIIGTSDFTDFVGAVKCADIDNDGDVDVIVCVDGHKTGPINIYLLENPGPAANKNPWPQKKLVTIDGWHANDLVIHDMDGDQKLDLVVRHKEPHDVKIIFQEADTWTVKYVGTRNGEGLSIGDLDHDGLPDISVSGTWYKSPSNPRKMEYRLLKYTDYTNIATKEAIGDLNNDGRPDIVLSPAEAWNYYGTPGDTHELTWYEAPKKPTKSSSWKKHVVEPNTNDLSFVRLGDFDNDGDLDIVSGRTWRGAYIKIYFNDMGSFERSITVADGKGVYSGAVADMDGDGDLDLVGEETYSNSARPYYYENLLID